MSARAVRRGLLRGTGTLLLALAALAYLAPLALMVVGSFKPEGAVLTEVGSWRGLVPREVTAENYADVFARVPFARYLLNSLLVNGGIVLGGLVVNALCGYAIARLRWAGARPVSAFVLVVLVVPLEAIAVPLFYQVTRAGLWDTYAAQILPFVAHPLSIWLFASFFSDIPRAMIEAARIDGAGEWRIFLTVVAPNSRPAFAANVIVMTLLFWGLYLWPLLVTGGPAVRPLPLGIATFFTLPPLQWGDILAFGVLMILPVVVLFLLFQRWFVRGVAATGIKG